MTYLVLFQMLLVPTYVFHGVTVASQSVHLQCRYSPFIEANTISSATFNF